MTLWKGRENDIPLRLSLAKTTPPLSEPARRGVTEFWGAHENANDRSSCQSSVHTAKIGTARVVG